MYDLKLSNWVSAVDEVVTMWLFIPGNHRLTIQVAHKYDTLKEQSYVGTQCLTLKP